MNWNLADLDCLDWGCVDGTESESLDGVDGSYRYWNGWDGGGLWQSEFTLKLMPFVPCAFDSVAGDALAESAYLPPHGSNAFHEEPSSYWHG